MLRELSLSAMRLAEARFPLESFVERVAERLGARSALLLTRSPGAPVQVLASAGLSRASRQASLQTPSSGDPVLEDGLPELPYPEWAGMECLRWTLPLASSVLGEGKRRAWLVVYFPDGRAPPETYRGVLQRVVTILGMSLTYRRVHGELQDSYEQLARTQEKLVAKERLAALGEMSAVVAHEVRNPLAVIFNAVGSMRRLISRSSQAGMFLDIIGEESERLNRIIDDMLTFGSPREVALRPERVEPLLTEAMDSVRNGQLGSRGTQLELDIPLPLPPVEMDSRVLRHAIVNLLVNAVQASPPRGRVTMTATLVEREGQSFIQVDVTDQGSGIRPELAERVFEPFFTTKSFGTGLGLAVVRRIVEAHRGEIEVRSQAGAGTTFSVSLPLAPV